MKTGNKKSMNTYLSRGWKSLKIKQLATKVTAGGTPSTHRSEFWGGNIPWMNSGEINLKKINSVSGRITQLGLKESAAKMIPPYSILIALAGQGKTRGTVAINIIKLCTNQSLAGIITNNKILPYYLYHNLDFRYKELRAYSTGDGGRGGLNLKIINNIKINFPENRQEQKKIVEVLSTWDQAIEKLEKLISAKQKQFQWLLKTLITDQQNNPNWKKKIRSNKILNPEQSTHDVQANVSWPIVSLGDLCEILDSRRKPITKSDRKSGPYPYYGATGILDYVDNYIFNEQLVLVGEDGAKWDSGEQTAFIAKGYYWVNNHIHVLKPIRKKIIDEWLVHILNKMDLTPHLTGSTVLKLNKKNLCLIKILLPPLSEQKRIVEILSKYEKEIEILKKLSQKYQKQKKGLMQKLLTGQWRIKL